MGWREEGGFNPDDYGDLLDYVPALRKYEYERGYAPRHLDLFALADDADAWVAAALHPDMAYASKHGEWNFVLDEPVPDVFVFPFLQAEFCAKLVEEAEHFDHFLGFGEGPNSNDRYPTTDVRLASMPHPATGEDSVNAGYLKMLEDYIAPLVWHVWKYKIEFYQWAFVARYQPSEQPFLGFHHDVATMALVVTLNEEGREFDGGGTFFERNRFHHRNVPVGYASLHPSRLTHRHGAKAVTRGTRYVLNTFID